MPRRPEMIPVTLLEPSRKGKPMPPRSRLHHRHHDTPEASSFDGLAKRVASRTLSRGQAIKTAGTALLATLVGGSVTTKEAETKTQRVCKGKAFLNNKNCEGDVDCSPTSIYCECARTVHGHIRCVNNIGTRCPTTDQCGRNKDCPQGAVCIQLGGCCGNPEFNVCVPLCTDF